jgi:dephospho-CoA kinase
MAAPMRVVAFTGMPGAGKSEAVAVAQQRGCPVIQMGDVVRDEARDRGLGMTDRSVGALASRVREEEGMDAWARRTCERIRSEHADAELVVIDGVRNWEEVDRFRKELGEDFRLVAITSAPEVRNARMVARGRLDDPKTGRDFQSRDEREMGWGIARAIALADAVITNEADLEAFRERVARFFDSVDDDA